MEPVALVAALLGAVVKFLAGIGAASLALTVGSAVALVRFLRRPIL